MTAPNPDPTPGAAGTGGTPAGQDPNGGQPNNPPAGSGPAPAAGTKPEATPSAQTDLATLPKDVQDLIKGLRDEAAGHRTGKQDATKTATDLKAKQDAILKALGLTPDGKAEPLTQDQIDAKIEEYQNEVWTTKVENVVLRIPGIDVSALWDSRKFIDSLDPFADRDPRDAEFAKDLADHVTKYVKDNPQFAAKPAGPARSGGDHPGGAGAATSRPTLSAAIANAMRPGR